jgi:hypothetical protein
MCVPVELVIPNGLVKKLDVTNNKNSSSKRYIEIASEG